MTARITLDHSNFEPLHHQLAESLRELIRSGELSPGDPLPSERELCEQLSLSRGTVRQALLNIISEGLAYTQRGKGNFVASGKVEQTLLSLPSVVLSLRRGGHQVVTKPLGVFTGPSSPTVSRSLEIPVGSMVVRARRLRLLNSEPFLLSTTVIPESRCPGFTFEGPEATSLYELIEQCYGIRVVRVRSTLETTALDEFEADLLGAHPSLPAFRLGRVALSSDGQPFAFTVHLIRGDRCQFSFDTEGEVVAPTGVLGD
jgi:GntR family transcriptional regulator